MWDLKGFVASMKRKPSGQRARGGPAVGEDPLKSVLELVKDRLAKAGLKETEFMKRTALAQMVLPEVLPNQSVGTALEPDAKASKEWAFTCGQMVGMIAGLTLKKSSIDGAVAEIFKQAKRTAHEIDSLTTDVDMPALRKPQDSKKEAETTKEVAAKVAVDTKAAQKKMIEELRDQALMETDAAAKAALTAHADRMQRTLELEEKAV